MVNEQDVTLELERIETRLATMIGEISGYVTQLRDAELSDDEVRFTQSRYNALLEEHNRIHARVAVLREIVFNG